MPIEKEWMGISMEEKERDKALLSAPDEEPVLSEEVPAVQTDSPADLKEEQNSRPEGNTARTQPQILSIQKRKKTKGNKSASGLGKEERRLRHEIVEKNDIRYRGPLSYRHMMILGWTCIILQQVSIILSTAGQFDSGIAASSGGLVEFGSFAGSLFMPFLLLANFSQILSSRQKFKSLLLKYGGLSIAMGLGLVVVYEHYVKGLANTAAQIAPEFGEELLLLFQNEVFKNGFLAYNMFIDLFLCTLFMFFLTYHFKRPVKRGWVICFRLLAILPVAYEIACIVLKTMCKTGAITLPMYASPFLTTKPPMTFAAFIALALFIKRRERIFIKNDRSHEEYGHFLETNANSLHFSVHACVTFIVAALLDVVILIVLSSFMTAGDILASGQVVDQVLDNKEMVSDVVTRMMNVAVAAGFGKSMVLFVVAPIVLLFSYSRRHKDTKMDMLIPMIAIAIIVVIYFEAIFLAACELPNILKMYLESLPDLDLSQLGLSDAELLELMQLLSQPIP